MKKIILILTTLFLILGCVIERQPTDEEILEQERIAQENFTQPQLEPAEEIIDELLNQPKEQKQIESENLHWTHMPITYYITNEEECGDYETRKIKKAFYQIENATNGIVTFKKINQQADINITCSFIEDCYEKTIDIRREEGVIYRYESICNHTKGNAITTTRGNEILSAEIELIGLAGFSETNNKGPSGFYIGSCGHTTTELHEIFHTFGFEHDPDPDSIMYFEEDSIGHTIQENGECIGSEKEIDKNIIKTLIDTYS